MKNLSVIFSLLFLSSCAPPVPTDRQCQHTFGLLMLQNLNFIECRKKELINDFWDYMDYIDELGEIGELHDEVIPGGIPFDLRRAKRVFCARSCDATSYLHNQCFVWESPKRRAYQVVELQASREPESCKSKYYNMFKGQPLPPNLDWKKGWKYNNYKTNGYKRLGRKIWKSL